MNDRRLGVLSDRMMMADEAWGPGHGRAHEGRDPFPGMRYPRLFIPIASLVLWALILGLAMLIV